MSILKKLTVTLVALSFFIVQPGMTFALAPCEYTVTLSDGKEGDFFGKSLDVDGDYMVVAAPGKKIYQGLIPRRVVYVLKKTTDGWVKQTALFAGNYPSDFENISVAISGDTIVVGADHAENNNHQRTGAAYVFKRNQLDQWSQQATLFPVQGQVNTAYSDFGGSVDIENGTIAVGANRANGNVGAVYMFTFGKNNQWTQTAIVRPFNNPNSVLGENFGQWVSLNNGTLAVTSGAILQPKMSALYIFEKNNLGVWAPKQRIMITTPDDVYADVLFTQWGIFGSTRVVNGSLYVQVFEGTSTLSNVGETYLHVYKKDAAGQWVLDNKIPYVGPADEDNHVLLMGFQKLFKKLNGTWQEFFALSDPQKAFEGSLEFDEGMAAYGSGEAVHIYDFNIYSQSETYATKSNTILSAGNINYVGAVVDPRTILQNDQVCGKSLESIQVKNPLHGKILNINNQGHFVYQPDPGFAGTDFFTYTLNNGVTTSSPTFVYIKVSDSVVFPNFDRVNNPSPYKFFDLGDPVKRMS